MSETCSTVDREKHNECKYVSMSVRCNTVDREKHNQCKYLSMSKTCSTVYREKHNKCKYPIFVFFVCFRLENLSYQEIICVLIKT